MTLRERLRRAEQRLASLRDDRAAARRTYDEAAEALSDAPEDAGDDHEAVVASRDAREALEAIDAQIEQAERLQTELLRQQAAEGRPEDAADPDADPDVDDPEGVERISRESLASYRGRLRQNLNQLVRGEEAQQLARVAHGRTQIGRANLGQAADRREFLAALNRPDLAGLLQPDRRGLIEPTLEPLTFLDFLPWAGTDSNSVQYVQATTLPSDAAAVAPTAEGVLKPEMNPLVFEDADAPIRTIAAWTKQKRQVLDDAPFLEGLLQTLLVYEVRRALQSQIVAGSGVGENIEGLLTNADVLAYVRGTEDVGENQADAILHGIAEVEDHLRAPQLVLVNPRDRVRIRLMRNDAGAGAGTGDYLFGPPSMAGPSTIWDLPMVVERAMPEGTALVADPAGALGLLRSGVDVLVSDSDQDDFVKNRITLLAELRAGLAVLRPDAFCKVDITEPGP